MLELSIQLCTPCNSVILKDDNHRIDVTSMVSFSLNNDDYEKIAFNASTIIFLPKHSGVVKAIDWQWSNFDVRENADLLSLVRDSQFTIVRDGNIIYHNDVVFKDLPNMRDAFNNEVLGSVVRLNENDLHRLI